MMPIIPYKNTVRIARKIKGNLYYSLLYKNMYLTMHLRKKNNACITSLHKCSLQAPDN